MLEKLEIQKKTCGGERRLFREDGDTRFKKCLSVNFYPFKKEL